MISYFLGGCDLCGGICVYCISRLSHTPLKAALVYDILPSTTAVFSYAIGSRTLSALVVVVVAAQTVVSLLQTTQIITMMYQTFVL